jgi:hypothetical protein
LSRTNPKHRRLRTTHTTARQERTTKFAARPNLITGVSAPPYTTVRPTRTTTSPKLQPLSQTFHMTINSLGFPYDTDPRGRSPPSKGTIHLRTSDTHHLVRRPIRASRAVNGRHRILQTIIRPPRPAPTARAWTHAFKNHPNALLIKAVPSIYINDFDDATMGYAQATSEQLLTHLVESYGRITARELGKYLARIKVGTPTGQSRQSSPMAPTAESLPWKETILSPTPHTSAL